jgi:hypothetical protein
MVEESAQWTAPEPELPAPPLPPRERRPRNDPLSGLAEELGRVSPPPAPAHFEPPQRQAPRRELRVRPQPPSSSASASAPAADAKFTSPSDQNLTEMAQRLEAALRRPNKTDDVRPPQSAPNAEPSGEENDELTPAPASLSASRAAPPADSSTPARNDGGPARSDAKPVPQKSLYDSLEQEMASLLGRPGSKN